MKLHREALKHAKTLIQDGKYVADTNWSEDQPSTDEENRFLDKHSWDEYGKWYLGLDTDENEETKGRHNFP